VASLVWTGRTQVQVLPPRNKIHARAPALAVALEDRVYKRASSLRLVPTTTKSAH
jgi:hypothetical protein